MTQEKDMMHERPLYKDPQISIEPKPESPEDFFLYLFRDSKEECKRYAIPKGCLREIATTPRDGLELKIRAINESMVSYANEKGISIEALGLAIAQAYIEERKRYENYATAIRSSQPQ
jgi:hypothetical protein